MNLLDAAILVLLALSVVNGFRRGAMLQVITFGGLLVGLVVGAVLAPQLASLADDPAWQSLIALGSLLLIAGLFDAAGWAIGTRAWTAARRSHLGVVDSWAGVGVAAVSTLLVVWFLAFNLVQGPIPALSREIRASSIVRGIDAMLPRPPSILAQVRSFLDRFGFPEVFQGLPPAPAGPVEGPSRGEVGRAVDAAAPSTLRVVGRACDRIQAGTAFIVADGYAVTNAHVVAGVDAPQVQQQSGGSIDATTVLFDPDLDLAVLRIATTPAAPLDLLAGNLDRGQGAAVLGYPQGGGLTVGPAAVRRVMQAVGRDIYGRDTVSREVYELQAEVRPGNSGGPFVTADGDVAGIVFAASVGNDDVGYALTSTEALPRVERGIGRTEPTDTGPCLR
ncbi:MAG TPA: MarP family serine protease [Actinomycetota bacterium]